MAELSVCQNTPAEHFDRDVPANAMDLQPAAAHALFFDEKQFARLQAEMYFLPRTCRDKKWIDRLSSQVQQDVKENLIGRIPA